MTSEERQKESGRSLSPYHQKCFPPYCDNAGAVHKQAISKMTRDELEDKYIVYIDEYFVLKRQLNDNEKQLQRLRAALTRQDNKDKKGGAKVTTSAYYDSCKMNNLESENTILQARVNVLRQQLMNHSCIHSKERHMRDSAYPDSTFRGVCQSQSAREESKSPSARESLRDRVTRLEGLLETQKVQYDDKIKKLEKELVSKSTHTNLQEKISQTSRKVNDNMEIIRLRRLSEEQAEEIQKLRVKYESANGEISEVQDDLKKATADLEETQKQLERERDKLQNALTQVAAGTSNLEMIKALEEQIRDLQNEKQALKDVNEQLLQITSAAQSKSDRSLTENMLKKQISVLELELKEKNKLLEEKEEELLRWQDLEKEREKAAEVPVTTLYKSPSHSQTELLKENEDLRNQLETVKKNNVEDVKTLEAKLLVANQEIDELKEKLISQTESDTSLKQEYEEVQKKLAESLDQINVLKLIAAEHDMCHKSKPVTPVPSTHIVSQVSTHSVGYQTSKHFETEIQSLKKENNELQNKLEDAVNELNELQLNHIQLKGENEELQKKVDEAETELTTLRAVATDHEQVCLKSKPATPVPSKTASKHTVTFENQLKTENEELQKKLEEAETELTTLRVIAADHEQCLKSKPVTPVPSKISSKHTAAEDPQLKREVEELKQSLDDALQEISTLRAIAAEHENCIKSKPPTPVPSKISSKHTAVVAPDNELKEELELLQKNYNEAVEELIILRAVAAEHEKDKQLGEELERLKKDFDSALEENAAMKDIVTEHENDINKLKEELEQSKKDLDDATLENADMKVTVADHEKVILLKEELLDKLKYDLDNALQENVAMKVIVVEHENCAKPVTPVPSKTSSKHIDINKLMEELEQSKKDLDDAKLENATMKVTVADHEKDILLKEELLDKLQHDLDNALQENVAMKVIVVEHENCAKPVTPVPSKTSSKHIDNLLKEEVEKLKIDLAEALQENAAMKLIVAEHEQCPKSRPVTPVVSKQITIRSETVISSDNVLKQELEQLKKDLAEAKEENAFMKVIVAEHEQCAKPVTPVPSKTSSTKTALIDSQLKEQFEQLKKDLENAFQENAALKAIVAEHENCGKRVTPVPSKTSSTKTANNQLKEEVEQLKTDLENALQENATMKAIVAEHENCGKRVTPVPSKTSSTKTAVSSSHINQMKEELEQLKQTLDNALQQNAAMRIIVAEHENECQLNEKLEQLKKELANALQENATMKVIVDEHENCIKRVTPVPSKTSSTKAVVSSSHINQLNEALEKLKQELDNAIQENAIMKGIVAEHANCAKCVTPVPSKTSTTKSAVSSTALNQLKEELEQLKKELDNASQENTALKTIVAEHELCGKRLTPVPSKTSSKKAVSSSHELRNQIEILQKQLENNVEELTRLKCIAAEHSLCPKVQPLPPSKHSIHEEVVPAPSQKSLPRPPSQHTQKSQEIIPSQPSQHTLLSQPSAISVQDPTITVCEPPKEPVVLIVSKHEFEKVLKADDGAATSDSTEGCTLDIGIHAVEMDIPLRDYLYNEYDSLYLRWKFLGLSERTQPSPVRVAEYRTKVTYCGPRSPQFCNHVNEKPVSLILTGVNKSGERRLGRGSLDMSPCLYQPDRKFLRCVPVETSHGNGLVYCSFKMNKDCCCGLYCPNGINCTGCEHVDCPNRITVRDTLEIGIGRLKLDNFDFPTTSTHPHVYVEYSILGYCGNAMETESEPKSDVLQYNHRKRFNITKNNEKAFEAMIRPDNPQPLTFTVVTEPCDLSKDSEVEEIGWASVNLNQEMVQRDRDMVSTQVPVVDRLGRPRGSLSVTVLGIDTVRRHSVH